MMDGSIRRAANLRSRGSNRLRTACVALRAACRLSGGRMLLRSLVKGYEHEAEDVLQDFFVALLERRSRFTPARGRAIPWMCEAVRALARERNPDWDEGP